MLFFLKHSSMISLIENGVLANIGILPLNQILLSEKTFTQQLAALKMPLKKPSLFAD